MVPVSIVCSVQSPSVFLQSDRGRSVEHKVIESEAVEGRLLRRGLRPRWTGVSAARFRGLTSDSRQVQPGDLFCAVAGTRVDGHDFVAHAARAGAAAAVVEHEVAGVSIPQLVVSDSAAALSHLAALFCGDPAERLHLVGITGTNGKSTTAWWTRHVLADLEPAAALGTLGSLGIDGTLTPGGLTTPDALALAERLAAFLDSAASAVVMEVSSHALEQRRADGHRFDVAVFTSFSREHLDYHEGMDAYLAAKLRFVDLLGPEGQLAVNADEAAWEAIGASGHEVLTYGLGPDADVRAESVALAPDGSRWRLVTPGDHADVDLKVPGRFNVYNALAAAAVGHLRGMSARAIGRRLSGAPGVPGRMEVLRREPSVVVRDYAHTPDAYELVLDSLASVTRGRLIAVFGCGGDRDAGKRPLMGQVAARWADRVLVTEDNPRTEDPAAIARDVLAGVDPEHEDRVEYVPDREDAIARALGEAGPDDVVVLLGKGHETYQVRGTEKFDFDERAIVERLTDRSA